MNMLTEEQVIEAHAFYKEALEMLNETGASYMLGGAFAFFHYTGIFRDTKDLDVFCKASEYPKIMKFFSDKGYRTELSDARWLGKIFSGEYYIDIIFDTVNNIVRVDDSWYQNATKSDFKGIKVLLIPPEELIWAKMYVQNRERFDGSDVNHLMLKQGKNMDWKRLRNHLDQHWHLLLSQLIMFQFIYPSDYQDIIPRWLFDELIERAKEQYDLPSSVERVCRGPIIDQTQYGTDIKEWNYRVMTMRTV
ncbi:MAG TPA: nucleotidyltransferase [Bacteroidales bacterium]|nr:nucleotidyltransferase [Bacteroidales bacterium]